MEGEEDFWWFFNGSFEFLTMNWNVPRFRVSYEAAKKMGIKSLIKWIDMYKYIFSKGFFTGQ